MYDAVRAEYRPNASLYPTYAKHIWFAIHYGVTDLLTRHRDPARSAANGRVACPTRYARPQLPVVHECDEYPFRSTMEGAAEQTFGTTFHRIDLNGPGTYQLICKIPASDLPRRNTYMAGGYSACMIPETENSGGGGDLSKFYIDYRVIPGDVFRVNPD